MEAQPTLRFDEHRRANRVQWDRPVRITQPMQAQGRVVDASAVGLLVRVERRTELHQGDWIAVEIPRSEDGALLCRHGRIARVDYNERDMLLGLELS